MSLDVCLTLSDKTMKPAQIYARQNGQTRAITREEWEARFPGTEPCVLEEHVSDQVYAADITHNLNTMAVQAGIYQALWHPEKIGIATASQLIEPLQRGLTILKSDPSRFQKLNPENGWGNYEILVSFVSEYLDACLEYPDALVKVSR